MASDEYKVPSAGGPRREEKTSWTKVRRAQGSGDDARKARASLALSLLEWIQNTANLMTGVAHDVRDLVQSTCERILNGDFLRGATPAKGSLHAWLATCMWRLFLKEIRGNRARRAESIDAHSLVSPQERIEDALDRDAQMETLTRAYQALEERLAGTTVLVVFRRWLSDPTRHEYGWRQRASAELGMEVYQVDYALKKGLGLLKEEVERLRRGA